MTNRNQTPAKISRNAKSDSPGPPAQFGQLEFSKRPQRLRLEIAVASGLAVSLDCRYRPNDVYEALVGHYRAEFGVQTSEADDDSKLLDAMLARAFAWYATEHFEEDLPTIFRDALQSSFREAIHNAKFDWGDPADLPAKLKRVDPDWIESAASRVDSKKDSSAQECVKLAADSARSRITKRPRNRQTLARAASEKREAEKLKRKILAAILRLVHEEEGVPKKAAVARQSGISYSGNRTQKLNDVLERYGWSFRELVLEAISSDS
jgi:hypothetical protein